MKIWDEVEKAYAERKVVIGRVIERIKGGLAVDIGVRAFLPGSQIDVRPVRNLDALRGQELRMRVIKVNKKRGNIVLSRKALSRKRTPRRRSTRSETLAEGKVLKGVVKNITDYGAFIDLGGIDGLLHITDMSWGRVGHPSELFKVNDEIDVIVLKYDPGHRARLARAQTAHHRSVGERDGPLSGRRAHGRQGRQPDRLRRVRGARSGRRRADPRQRDVVEQARQAPVEDPQRRRHRGRDGPGRGSDSAPHFARSQAGRDQSVARPRGKYPVGSKITGKVRNLTEFGAFVEVEEEIDGLIHISTCRGASGSSIRPKSSRRATSSRRWC
jgi:small subunit ribosomal protein S1